MTETLNIGVVGAGIVGVSTAEHLRRRGHQVALIDRVRPGDAAQTSYGNAGLLATSSVVPVTVPSLPWRTPRMLLSPNEPLFLRWRSLPRLFGWLVRFLAQSRHDVTVATADKLAVLTAESPAEHLSLAQGTPAEQYLRMSDMAYLYPGPAAFRKDQYARDLRARHGHTAQHLTRPALTELDPNLSPHYTDAAVFGNHGYLTDPGRYVAALAGHFATHGGTVQQAEVRDVQPLPDGRGAVRTPAGQQEFDRVVICAGAWSDKLLEPLGYHARLESERGYHIFLRNANPLPPIPYLLADAKFAVTPMGDHLRFAGVVELASREHGPSTAPLAFMRRAIRRVYPDLTWEHEETWLGHRPTTIDSVPMLGPVPDAPGIHCAFGTQHIGITCGPKIGRLMAENISGPQSNLDLSAYRVDRFTIR